MAGQGLRRQFAEGLLVGRGEMAGLGEAPAKSQVAQLQFTRLVTQQKFAYRGQPAGLNIALRAGAQAVAESLLQAAPAGSADAHQLADAQRLIEMGMDEVHHPL